MYMGSVRGIRECGYEGNWLVEKEVFEMVWVVDLYCFFVFCVVFIYEF